MVGREGAWHGEGVWHRRALPAEVFELPPLALSRAAVGGVARDTDAARVGAAAVVVGQVEEGDERQAVRKGQRAREHDGRRPEEPLEAVDRGGEALGVGLHEHRFDDRPLLAQVGEQRIQAAEQVASLEQLGALGVWPQQRERELVCGGEQLDVARPLGGLAERHLLEQHHREHHALVRYLQLRERLAQLRALG